MTGAMLRGKTADAGLNIGAQLCDTRKKRATASRFLFSEYKLHIAAYRQNHLSGPNRKTAFGLCCTDVANKAR